MTPPRSEGVQYATGEEQRAITNSSRKNETTVPKDNNIKMQPLNLKKVLFHGRKTMMNLDSILKSRDITLPSKVCIAKAILWLGEKSITSYMQVTPPYGKKQRGTKEPLDEGKRGERKGWLET